MDIFVTEQALRIGANAGADLRDVKRALTQMPVSRLLVAYQLNSRETGLDLLRWAKDRGCLPDRVNIVERNVRACKVLGEFLVTSGFRPFNDREYLRIGAGNRKPIR